MPQIELVIQIELAWSDLVHYWSRQLDSRQLAVEDLPSYPGNTTRPAYQVDGRRAGIVQGLDRGAVAAQVQPRARWTGLPPMAARFLVAL
jgi:hypothetical protein